MTDLQYKGSYIKKFLEKKGISVIEAAKQLGVHRQTVYQYFKSDNLSREVVNQILTTFDAKMKDIFEVEYIPKVSGTTSDAHHRKNEDSNETFVNDPDTLYNAPRNGFHNKNIDLGEGRVLMITPLVEEYAQAGFLSGFSDPEFLQELPNHSIIVDKFHKGKYFSFRVIGDSMNDGTSESIVDGSIVTAREIQKSLWNSRFHIHRFQDYVIAHKEGILIKRISGHDVEKGVITCSSLNPDKNIYGDFDLELDDCNMILNIVNVSTKR